MAFAEAVVLGFHEGTTMPRRRGSGADLWRALSNCGYCYAVVMHRQGLRYRFELRNLFRNSAVNIGPDEGLGGGVVRGRRLADTAPRP